MRCAGEEQLFPPSPLAQQLLSKLIIFHFHTHWLARRPHLLIIITHMTRLSRTVVAESLFIYKYIYIYFQALLTSAQAKFIDRLAL